MLPYLCRFRNSPHPHPLSAYHGGGVHGRWYWRCPLLLTIPWSIRPLAAVPCCGTRAVPPSCGIASTVCPTGATVAPHPGPIRATRPWCFPLQSPHIARRGAELSATAHAAAPARACTARQHRLCAGRRSMCQRALPRTGLHYSMRWTLIAPAARVSTALRGEAIGRMYTPSARMREPVLRPGTCGPGAWDGLVHAAFRASPASSAIARWRGACLNPCPHSGCTVPATAVGCLRALACSAVIITEPRGTRHWWGLYGEKLPCGLRRSCPVV